MPIQFPKSKDRKPTVLVVDDLPSEAEVVDMLLSREGYQVTQCLSGFEAIRIAVENPPDIVLLDIAMSPVNGWEVLEKLREHRVRTRVILFSMFSTIDFIVRGIKAGACDFVAKPASAAEH